MAGTAVDNSATFTWAPVTDTIGGISGYRVIISTDASGNNVIFNGLVGNVTTFTLTTATPGQTLFAKIDAVNNAGIEGPVSPVSAGAPVLESFAYWENKFSITSASATPFNDGVTNLLKYYLDINPMVAMAPSDVAALPAVGKDTTTNPGTTFLTMTYRQFALETGVTVNVQTSVDLQTWTTVVPAITKQLGTDPKTGDPIMEVEVRQAGNKQFIRLHVTSP